MAARIGIDGSLCRKRIRLLPVKEGEFFPLPKKIAGEFLTSFLAAASPVDDFSIVFFELKGCLLPGRGGASLAME
jgi:hypothetical protein